MEDWPSFDDLMSFDAKGPLHRDVLLTGSLLIIVRRQDGSPCAGERVMIRGCGFV